MCRIVITVFIFVGVIFLRVNASFVFDKIESQALVSSCTSFVVIVSVDEVLLGKTDKIPGLNKGASLQGSSSREGPATSTSSLIFNLG